MGRSMVTFGRWVVRPTRKGSAPAFYFLCEIRDKTSIEKRGVVGGRGGGERQGMRLGWWESLRTISKWQLTGAPEEDSRASQAWRLDLQ